MLTLLTRFTLLTLLTLPPLQVDQVQFFCPALCIQVALLPHSAALERLYKMAQVEAVQEIRAV